MWPKPESLYAQEYHPVFTGGVTGASYVTVSATDVNIWTPAVAGDRAYNHAPFLWRTGSRIWIFFNTHSTNEDQQGLYIRACYSDDEGETWSSFYTAIPAFEAMSTATDQTAHTVGVSRVITTQLGKSYLISIVQTVVWVSGSETARTSVGVLAVEINGTSFGTPGYIFLTGSPVTYSIHPDAELINTEYLARGKINEGQVIGDLIESGVFFKGGRWIRLARGYNTLTAQYVYSAVSTDGINYGSPSVTSIPNSPSKVRYLYHSTGKHLFFFNPQNATLSRNPLAMLISTDGLNWGSNAYAIRSVTTDVPVYAGANKGGGCAYPHAIERTDGKVLIAYSIAKEQIAASIVSLP